LRQDQSIHAPFQVCYPVNAVILSITAAVGRAVVGSACFMALSLCQNLISACNPGIFPDCGITVKRSEGGAFSTVFLHGFHGNLVSRTY